MGTLVESLAQLRPRATPGRYHWVGRLILENLGKNVAHYAAIIVRRNMV
jgi:hypothetical protein